MSMRTYGRLLKNIAAIALLLALLSMLLPFCKFSAGGQEMTLSGLDVVKAGGRAGYTYLTEGRVADTFVLKAPITVGTVKSSLSYVQGVGQMRLLAVCAIAALLPVLLCFLSVGMLFLAEGKKTMLLPTLFTSLVLAELLIVLAVFPALYPFLLSGIYFFTLLHGVAWILILTGWITGGYRPPEKQGNEQIKREKNPKRSGHGWRRKKAHRRRKSKKKRSRKEDSSTKKKNTAGNKTFEWKHCQISYDPSKQTYRMISDSPEPFIFSCGYVPPESLHCHSAPGHLHPEFLCDLPVCGCALPESLHYRRSDHNYAFQLPFSLIFSKTFSLSSQLQNIDKKGNYKAVDKIRK